MCSKKEPWRGITLHTFKTWNLFLKKLATKKCSFSNFINFWYLCGCQWNAHLLFWDWIWKCVVGIVSYADWDLFV